MIYVFCGPTIAFDDVRRHDASLICLPPAAQGDVYRAALDRPQAIAIVDGYFERVPSVWHKEILWALSEGIRVYGSSSMGALRAAELEAFGMVGVGRIFEAFRDGTLEDDDEVAVVHGDADTGFRAASEAMVNIRATLDRALDEGRLDEGERAAFESAAKALPYPRRSFAETARSLDGRLDADRLRAFVAWTRDGRVDRKRDDALELLGVLSALTGDAPAPRPRWEFQHTEIWEHALRAGGREPVRGAPLEASESLLDELRLLGRETYLDRRDVWLGRALALEVARRHEAVASDEALGLAASRTRRRHALDTHEALLEWASREGLDEDGLTALLRDESMIDSMRSLYGRELERQIAADLRSRGRLSGLLARVDAKRRVLGDDGVASPDGETIEREALLEWHFGRLGTPIPDDLDQYARDLDLPGADVLLRTLRRDYRYERSKKTN